MNKRLKEKIEEALSSVVPITAIVLLLSFTMAPMPVSSLMLFLVGALLLIVGVGLFSLGVDLAMMPIGDGIGSQISKGKRLWRIIPLCFVIGVFVTIAEPDLTVLARQVPAVPDLVIILTVAVGVGGFLAVAALRAKFGWPLNKLLIVLYGVVFVMAFLVPKEFLAVAFDSGGVTTGPITVPFIMALGAGLTALHAGRRSEEDSFGVVALCSIGPILAVMVLGLCYRTSELSYTPFSIPDLETTADVGQYFAAGLPAYMQEVALGLLPIVAFFTLFQVVSLRLKRKTVIKIVVGMLYTYVGLVLFLTGVNVGFSALGEVLGAGLATGWTRWLLIPLSMLLGWFIISAEPAVTVLEHQIEEVSAGTVPGSAIKRSLSIAIALAMGLSMLRVLTGISIMWFLVPGYTIALGLSFFVPDLYTAIAFDSGGVASGPMTATFMLQFMIGASTVIGGNPLVDAFGVVAMVAMMPLISIQMVGFIYSRRAEPEITREHYGDDEIIELWEVNAA